ncbi:hypothetical protein GA0061098_1009186 [Bradyrhizobium shewense]|uniref:Uncharacterized protein n=1 Tax=Bradyrhizobium shewense TaxID=1761772 RepID=A0A1C3WS79_9BRAD|nr:hypothetical protein GA0061098_1009186 [Bradyrhizobium shewense]
MAPKYHPTPLSGSGRKALGKELSKSRAMTTILGLQSAEALIRQADKLLCESWNEKMWADGGPIDPSPTIDQAYSWLDIALQDKKGCRSGCVAAPAGDGGSRLVEPAPL